MNSPDSVMPGDAQYVGIRLEVNGDIVELQVEPRERLLDVLRQRLGLTGAKEGCGYGECGACTVLIDGKPVTSCLVLAAQAKGRSILTIEGMSEDGELHPLQRSFLERSALQCGFCIPGVLLALKPVFDLGRAISREEFDRALAGNLCRCTGYDMMYEATMLAVEQQPGG